MKRLRGSRQADKLQKKILDLIAEFDAELTEAGASEGMVDAHIAAIMINLLRLIVVERKTYDGLDLAKVVKDTMREVQCEH